MTVRDRPGDAEQARYVDAHQQLLRHERELEQKRADEERVLVVTVTNARTGASVSHNSRACCGWYRTEDGSFLATAEDIEAIVAKWQAAGEDRTESISLTGRQFREAEENGRLNP